MINQIPVILMLIIFSASNISADNRDISVKISQSAISEFNFSSPDRIDTLPCVLNEISGLTYISGNSFACIQDENGIVFFIDVKENRITRQLTFGPDGDYEGIARAGKSIWVLRSDGILTEIINFESDDFLTKSYPTGIPSSNNEGLCFDSANNRLLIGCKSEINRGGFKDKRVIFAFDLKSKLLSTSPVFVFDEQSMIKFALNNSIILPLKVNKKTKIAEPHIKFKISDICIHPAKQNLYLLSAPDHLLFIFDSRGNIEHIEQLAPLVFKKSEGIAFDINKDMLISNEGKGSEPTIIRINYNSH